MPADERTHSETATQRVQPIPSEAKAQGRPGGLDEEEDHHRPAAVMVLAPFLGLMILGGLIAWAVL